LPATNDPCPEHLIVLCAGGRVVSNAVSAGGDEGVMVAGTSAEGDPWAKLVWCQEWLPLKVVVPQWGHKDSAGQSPALDALAFSAREFVSKEAVQQSARRAPTLFVVVCPFQGGLTPRLRSTVPAHMLEPSEERAHECAHVGVLWLSCSPLHLQLRPSMAATVSIPKRAAGLVPDQGLRPILGIYVN
jgi:hypothetical protein